MVPSAAASNWMASFMASFLSSILVERFSCLPEPSVKQAIQNFDSGRLMREAMGMWVVRVGIWWECLSRALGRKPTHPTGDSGKVNPMNSKQQVDEISLLCLRNQ
jgi:hypothetical protein